MFVTSNAGDSTMAKKNKERQAAFKARQTGKDKRQLSVWISDDAYLVIKQRAEQDGLTIAGAVENAITSNTDCPVTGNIDKAVTSNFVPMSIETDPKTKLVKCACPRCGYTIRTTNKWIERAVPICPACSRITSNE